MTLKRSIIVGNPKPKSRTREVAAALGEKHFKLAASAAKTIDPTNDKDDILSRPSQRMDAATARVAARDIALVASPPCRATYAGHPKRSLDGHPANGPAGDGAVPVPDGADPTAKIRPTVIVIGHVEAASSSDRREREPQFGCKRRHRFNRPARPARS